jgi:voltage-gated potassium channel
VADRERGAPTDPRPHTLIRRLRRRWLRIVLPLSAIAVLLGGGGFAALETQNVSSYAEGVWWALSLMTTVGFVGESPETTGGRILSAVLMLFGFSLLSVTTAVIASLFVREDETPEQRREQAFEQQALQRLEDLGRRLDGLERRLSDRERR